MLLLLPLLLLLRGAAGRQSALQFSSLHLLRGAGRKTRSAMVALGMFLTVGAMALGIAGMARPQKLRTEEKIEESGVEIFMALDLSLSMSIQDMRVGNEKVDRLTVAKKVTRDFIRKRTGRTIPGRSGRGKRRSWRRRWGSRFMRSRSGRMGIIRFRCRRLTGCMWG